LPTILNFPPFLVILFSAHGPFDFIIIIFYFVLNDKGFLSEEREEEVFEGEEEGRGKKI
jgi:hypothetical protein